MALEIISKINIDLKHPNAEIVNAVQYDSTGIVEIRLLNNGEKWYVPTNVTSAVIFKKSDRIGGYYDRLTIGNNAAISVNSSDRSIVYLYLDIQTTTTSGNVEMHLVFFEGNKRLTTFSFMLKVQASSLSYADITSQWLFNVLAKANLVVDRSLTIRGAAADSKETGTKIQVEHDRITAEHERVTEIDNKFNLKVNKPVTSPNGISGQVLRTNGDGSTEWVTVGLPSDAQTDAAVRAWLDDHPEATTTVQDGSITPAKLSNDFNKTYITNLNNISTLQYMVVTS